jgi:zinc protease
MKKLSTLLSLPIFLLTFVFTQTVSAQTPNADQPIPNDTAVRTGTLPNGMKYYIKRNLKPEKRAEFRLAVNAGSVLENDDQQGLAHFNEHMAFNGTKNFAHNDIVNFLELSGVKFGADLNAYTSFDETVYMIQIPTDSEKIFNKGIQILEDWAHNLSFDSIEVDKERGVVISERRLGLGAFQRMQAQYWPIMFQGSRYADRIPIGKLDILENCKHSTLKQFYKDWYRPELMAIIAVGDFDVNKVEKMIKDKFSAIPANPNPRPRQFYDVPDTKNLLIAKATDKEDPYNIIELVYKHSKEHSRTMGDMKREITKQLFSGMLNSRLQELQKGPNPPFLFAAAGIDGLVRTKDAFTGFAYVNDMGIKGGIQALVTECERAKRFGFTITELDRQKKDLLRQAEQLLKEKDKTESKVYISDYVDDYLNNEPIFSIQFFYDYCKNDLGAITLDDVNQVSKDWITNNGENAVIVIQAPSKDSALIPSDDSIRYIFNSVQKKDLKPYVDKVTDKPLMVNMPTPGKVVSEKEIKKLGITEWTLANGVKVVVKSTDFKNDEIVFNAYRWGGTSLYPKKDYMSASNAAPIVDESGVGEFNSTALEKMLTGKIVSVSPSIGELTEGLSGKCSPQDLETEMQLINLYFTQPRKDDTAFEAYMMQRKGLVENRSSDPASVFGDTVSAVMSSHNYRRRPVTTSTLNEIDFNKAFEIYKQRFADAGGYTFFFVGSFKPEELKPLVETYIGSLPVKQPAPMWKDVGIVSPKGLINKTVVKGKEPKATVEVIFSGPFEYNRKNRMDMFALSSLLSIKLREELREEMSGVYGVYANGAGTHYPKQEYKFTVYFGCAPERTEELLTAAFKEIDSVKTFGCTDVNLQKIKETMKRQREVDLKDNTFWLNAISQNYQNNENILDLLDFNKYVDGITSDDFKRLANQYFNMKNYAKFVLMPEKQ